jgi:hypothetical protein
MPVGPSYEVDGQVARVAGEVLVELAGDVAGGSFLMKSTGSRWVLLVEVDGQEQ